MLMVAVFGTMLADGVKGLATLAQTPSPMGFLTELLGRPDNERPFIVFPAGLPADGCLVPDLQRKHLDEVTAVPPSIPAD